MKFPEASVVHLPKYKSDHCPVLLKIEREGVTKRGKGDLRFFAPWVNHNDFGEVVRRSWVSSRSWEENVQCFVGNVREWNTKVFGDVNRRKQKLLRRLDALNIHMSKVSYRGGLENERDAAWNQLEEVLVQEEVMWLQRLRCNWYKDGDRNTRYFYSMANSRKKRNRIEALKAEDGEWVYDQSIIMKMGTNFFKSLYNDDEEVMPNVNLVGLSHVCQIMKLILLEGVLVWMR